jgi:hypothetical protein
VLNPDKTINLELNISLVYTLKNMHLEILSKQQVKALPHLSRFKKDFYLAEDTAIALHLGHRQSIDFDLFSDKMINKNQILQKFKNNGFKIQNILQDNPEEITFISQNIKFTFLHYPFPVKAPIPINSSIHIPDLLSLAALKAYTLSRRNKWKDYVDLYFIIKHHYSLPDIIKMTKKIFKTEFNDKIFREALSYFKDIDYSEEVIFLPQHEVSNNTVKKYLKTIAISD